MKLKALSHYNGDKDTRYGDCFMSYNRRQLIVYDCGHEKHAEKVEEFLEQNTSIKEVYVVISHNDSDHTNGIVSLLEFLSNREYDTTLYTSLYLKHASKVEELLDDGRRSKKSICDNILEIFDNIAEIVETAQKYDIRVLDAIQGTNVADCEIVGPLEEEFVEVLAKAIEEDGAGTINGETVMNAASVQLKVVLSDDSRVLLCGDAAPNFLKSLNTYHILQFPHHGQYKDGIEILEMLGDKSYKKKFIISDNTGSGKTSGGSKELTEYMKAEKYTAPLNTLKDVITLPEKKMNSSQTIKEVSLGGVFVV